MNREILGLDRELSLAWLDATAAWLAEGVPPKEIRTLLDELLQHGDDAIAGASARGKTKTVLMHLWATVPSAIVGFRDEGLRLFKRQDTNGRLALHWGMALATYPFFRDVATVVGRLQNLQKTVNVFQVQRRIIEIWGDRMTVRVAAQRSLKSLQNWGVRVPAGKSGRFTAAAKISLQEQPELSRWLIEALLRAHGGKPMPLGLAIHHPALFPFQIAQSALTGENSHIEVFRLGLDEDLLRLRSAR